MRKPPFDSGAGSACSPIRPVGRAGLSCRLAPLLLALPLAVVPCSCSRPIAEASTPAKDDLAPGRVLAVVEGKEVRSRSFEEFLRLKAASAATGLSPDRRADLFQEFILSLVLESQAEQAGIVVDDAELQAKMEAWNPGGADPGPDSASQVRRLLRVQKLIQSRVLPDTEVTLREARDYYNRHAGDFIAADRVHVLEILVEDRRQLDQIRSGLKQGDIRAFKEAARRRSKGTTAEQSGDLGHFEEGILPKEFDRVVFSLKAGEISQPVQSGRGYHLFMVEEQIPRHHQKFYEVQKEIYEKLLADKERKALDSYLKQILKDASIEVRNEELRAEWRRRHAELNQ
ncbi:MAG: peptidylprolyl isomerase [Acidobacteriota bacterium]